jgi:hypothetical protein
MLFHIASKAVFASHCSVDNAVFMASLDGTIHSFILFAICVARTAITNAHLSNQSDIMLIRFGIHLSESLAGHSLVGE